MQQLGREGHAQRSCCCREEVQAHVKFVRTMWWLPLVLCLQLPTTAFSATLPSDVSALQEILEAWKETPMLAADWSPTTDPCGTPWRGISCSGDTVTSLKLNNSHIVGSLPSALGKLVNLQHLDLSGNPQLGGHFLQHIAQLPKLVYLNVSGCNISGTISVRGWGASATSQTRIQLRSVRLMKLEPEGVVMATRHSSPPSKSQGHGTFHTSATRSKSLLIAKIVGPIAGALVILSLLCACAFCWRWRKKMTPKPPSHDNASELFGLAQQQPSTIIAYEDVKAATRNFHRNHKIGEGAFGAVYKGVLGDGQEVAIKQLSMKSRQVNQEFMSELQLITSVQHPNIVRLCGCAIAPNSRLLIYEYLENRSLAQALFQPQKGVVLDWPTRFNIALGTAQGLAYLHNKSQARLVHSDIKATNILLDKNLAPKIADFGLARLFQNDSEKVHTFVAGTRGYVSPEYALQGQLTSKVDVFSYGIVALELVSGRKNMNAKLVKEQQYLLSWAWQLHDEDRILELIDPKVRDTCDEKQALLLIRIALLCTQDAPPDRPNMPRVIAMLTGDMPTPEVPLKPGFLAIGSGPSTRPSSRATSSTSLVNLEV